MTKFLLMIMGVVLLMGCGGKSTDTVSTEKATDKALENPANQTGELTPEEVLAQMDARENRQVEPKIKIVSPEPEVLSALQANFFNAEIEFATKPGYTCFCNWQFWINQKEEEVLDREQETTCAGDNKCGFTSSVYKKGKLRLKVDMIYRNYINGDEEIVATDEKKYTVGQ